MTAATGRLLVCALVALALACPPSARAEAGAPEAAREAFGEAAAFAAQKRWAEACESFARSLDLYPSPLTRYSLGVAQREAGRLVAARATLEAFLAGPATPRTARYAEHARAALVEIRARIATVTLDLDPAPPLSVTVTIDGVAVPASMLSAPQAVDPGAHEIVARAPGHEEARASVTLAEGGSASVKLTLSPRAIPAGAPAVAPLAPRIPPPSGTPASRAAPWPRALPAALLGAGGAVFTGGAALGLVGLLDAQKAPSSTGSEAADARVKGVAADVLMGTGIAAAGVGLVLFLVQPRRPAAPSARPAASASPASTTRPASIARPWIGGDQVGVEVSF